MLKSSSTTLFIFSLFLLFSVVMNSCTVTKRVHRKGWHISWNKNYRSDNSPDNETVENGNADSAKSDQEKKNVAINQATATENRSEDVNSEQKAENSFSEIAISDAIESSSSNEKENTSEDELPNSEMEESQDVKDLPLGGAYIFLGLFTAIGVGLLAFSAFEFALGAFLIAIAAAVIMAHVNGIKKGKNKKSHIRPSGYYNSILFAVLCTVILAYLIIYGGLGGVTGIIVAAFLVVLIALLIFLAYQTKDLHHAVLQKQKEKKEATQKHKAKEATPEEKKKSRIAGLIVGGLAVALFLTIALLNN